MSDPIVPRTPRVKVGALVGLMEGKPRKANLGTLALLIALGEPADDFLEGALGTRASGVLGAGDAIRMLAGGGRTAIVTAPGGHFFTVAGTARFQRDHPRLGRRLRVFSIHRPLPELVEELNRFNPAVLSGFLGMLTLLAGEQEAGRLRIRPALIIPGGETLTTGLRKRLATAFGAKVRAAYAATECGFLSMGCAHGWYHVSSDWVDADYRPTPPVIGLL
ncbi:hypothetical protein [Saccharopolyspora hattusasensis]|uniref:hypothetical protein n=1 Tax=Saccharopolyspora hattusasensis TaxID=1128679 RepID=UPI003D95B2AC